MDKSSLDNLHSYLIRVRALLRADGHQGPTVDSALLVTLELARFACSPDRSWRGKTSVLAEACEKSTRAIRRSLSVLQSSGLIRTRTLGALGIEVAFTAQAPLSA